MDRRFVIFGLCGWLALVVANSSTATAGFPFFKRFMKPRQAAPADRSAASSRTNATGNSDAQQPVAEGTADDAPAENVHQSQWELPVQGSSKRPASRSKTPSQRLQRTAQRSSNRPAVTSNSTGAANSDTAVGASRREPQSQAVVTRPTTQSETPSVTQPESQEAPQTAELPAAAVQQVAWQSDLHAAHKLAMETGRPMMIVFGAEWCHYCKQLENQTLSQPEMAEYINTHFVPIHLDMDQQRDKEIAAILEVKPIPCTVVLSPNADRVAGKILGYRDATQMHQALETARDEVTHVRQTRPVRTAGR